MPSHVRGHGRRTRLEVRRRDRCSPLRHTNVVDAADQTIFQHFGGLPADYQSYDKALDIYYLVIAYAAVLRNWSDSFAVKVAGGLLYCRLIGVVAFELSGARALFLIFPNTFEYFFIAYELIRLRWDPTRLRPSAVVKLAAGIWIFIKLPQEWWLHIAQLDVTDVMHDHHWVLPALSAVIVVAASLGWRHRGRLPMADWRLTLDADSHHRPGDVAGSPTSNRAESLWWAIAEKILLLGLVSVVFAEVLHTKTTHLQLLVSVAVLVMVNAGVSQAIVARGTTWQTTIGQFMAMAGINAVLVAGFVHLRRRYGAGVDGGKALVFLLLLSLIITLYDRYRAMRHWPHVDDRSVPAVAL